MITVVGLGMNIISRKKKFPAVEILEKLKWYHGESFTTDILEDEFKEMCEKEKNSEYKNNK